MRFADIIELFGIRSMEDAEKCQELWDINNCVTLCRVYKLKRLDINDVELNSFVQFEYKTWMVDNYQELEVVLFRVSQNGWQLDSFTSYMVDGYSKIVFVCKRRVTADYQKKMKQHYILAP